MLRDLSNWTLRGSRGARVVRRRAGLACAVLAVAGCAGRQRGPPLATTREEAFPPGAAELYGEPDLVGVIHVVKRGETIYRIAKTYGLTPRELMEVNELTDPRCLQVGMELFIPGAPRPLEVPPLAAGTVEPPSQVITAPSVLLPAVRAGKMRWPLQNGVGVLGRGFGVKQGQRHDGIDIAAPEGSPVVAAERGVVAFTGRQSGYGVIVILRHPASLATVYAHLSAVLVKEGDAVDAGTLIARVGQSGRATGPHLHFEVREGTTPHDPLHYLR